MNRIVQAVLALVLVALGAGCGSRLATPAFYPSPNAPTLAASVDAPLPQKTASPWNKSARAEHLVGSIAAALGVVQHEMDAARAARDVVRVQCVGNKYDELVQIERQARDRRAEIRSAGFDDDDAEGAYSTLQGQESRARALRSEAMQCIGEERAVVAKEEDIDGTPDSDADGIVDSVDKAPEPPMDQLKARNVAMSSKLAATPQQMVAVAHDPSMIIHTAEIALAVYEVAKNLQAVEKSTSELGGYLALRSDREITVRVPREKFEELVSRIEKMGDVLHKNVAAEDVTDQYVDLDMRLRNATAVRDRLEKLLANATVRDAVEIHKELAKVTEEIERFEGKLKLLRDRIAYSTVTVTFEQQQSQQVRSQALLPFPWMSTMGLSPLLSVPR